MDGIVKELSSILNDYHKEQHEVMIGWRQLIWHVEFSEKTRWDETGCRSKVNYSSREGHAWLLYCMAYQPHSCDRRREERRGMVIMCRKRWLIVVFLLTFYRIVTQHFIHFISSWNSHTNMFCWIHISYRPRSRIVWLLGWSSMWIDEYFFQCDMPAEP